MASNFRAAFSIAVLGTCISIAAGVFSLFWLEDPYKAIVLALLIELMLLLISLGVLVVELRSQFATWLGSMVTLINASNYVSTTRDEIFAERYHNIAIDLKELSEGRYSLANISEVYDDDIRSIRQMQKGESLFSMCPIQGDAEEASKQLQNKNFSASMDAHYRAANRQVNIHRIYIFEKNSTFESSVVQDHLHTASLANTGTENKDRIKVSIILLDDERFSDAKELPHDFIIFGSKKVSVGRIAPNSRVAGGDVFADRHSIEKYRMEYERLLRISVEYETYELQKNKPS